MSRAATIEGARTASRKVGNLPFIAIVPHELPDDELVRRCQQGERDALELLLRRHHDRIFALCRRITGNQADALDATQEALITIARRIDRFDGRSAFATWAYRVATNACLDELRRRKRRPEPVEVDLERWKPPAEQRLNGGGRDPGTTVPARLELEAALRSLPSEFRAAVVLRDVLTCDYAEIADVLEIPIGTVRSRIARGRALLAKQLAASGNSTTGPRRPTEHTDTSPTLPLPPESTRRPGPSA